MLPQVQVQSLEPLSWDMVSTQPGPPLLTSRPTRPRLHAWHCLSFPLLCVWHWGSRLPVPFLRRPALLIWISCSFAYSLLTCISLVHLNAMCLFLALINADRPRIFMGHIYIYNRNKGWRVKQDPGPGSGSMQLRMWVCKCMRCYATCIGLVQSNLSLHIICIPVASLAGGSVYANTSMNMQMHTPYPRMTGNPLSLQFPWTPCSDPVTFWWPQVWKFEGVESVGGKVSWKIWNYLKQKWLHLHSFHESVEIKIETV